MRSGTDRCAAIIDLIDRCLAEYDGGSVVAKPPDAASGPDSLIGVPTALLGDARLVDA